MPDQTHTCDVLVVGAGPAGVAAACVAAEAGRKVVVLESSPSPGGQIWRSAPGHPTLPVAQGWLQRLGRSVAHVIPHATAFASPARDRLLAETPDGVLDVAWRKLILATGARERFLPFPGWTLPGVMGPGGLHQLSKGGWPIAGKRVIVAGSGPLLLAVAHGLKQQGARVSLVAEQASLSQVMRFGLGLWRHPGKVLQGLGVKAGLWGVPYRCGCWPLKAEGVDRVQRVTLTHGTRVWTEDCDYLACGFHLVPNIELPLLLGCELTAGAVRVNDRQEASVPNVYCAGEPTGVGGVDCALIEGQIAGWSAAGAPEQSRELFPRRAAWHRFRDALNETFALRSELRRLPNADTIICRCEDVRREALESFDQWRAAKLHTRCGMGACQGRTCGAAAEFLFGWDNDSVRPPVFPVRVGSLLGPEPTNSTAPTPSKPRV